MDEGSIDMIGRKCRKRNHVAGLHQNRVALRMAGAAVVSTGAAVVSVVVTVVSVVVTVVTAVVTAAASLTKTV